MIGVLDTAWRLAHDQPRSVAITEDGAELNYAELVARAEALASFLQEHAIGSGQCVAFFKTSMTDTVTMALGALRAGVGFLILDPRDTPSKLESILATSGAVCVISDADLPFDTQVPRHRFSATMRTPVQDIPPPDPDCLGYIEPTSGSTGTPKLVPLSQATMQHYLDAQTRAAAIGPTDKVALLGEMWLDTVLTGLNGGAQTEAFDFRGQGASALERWMRTRGITVIQTYVAAFRALADAALAPLPELRSVRLAGEIVTRADVALFEALCPAGAVLSNYYGSTECSFIAEHRHVHGAPVAGKILPVGPEIAGTTVSIVAEDGTEMPAGGTGEFIVRADHMARAYLNNPEKTQGVFWQDPDGRFCLRTGDLGFRSADGQLHIVGRTDDQVKIRGYSVRYSEVEGYLNACAGIAEASVTSVVSAHGTRVLVGHMIRDEGAQITASHVKEILQAQCPAYMVPSYLMFHEELPRTDTGKVLRRALPDPFADSAQQAAARAPLSGLQAEVAQVWSSVLGRSDFAPDDDFFDVGGDSLQAMSMVLRLERAHQVRLGYESLVIKGAQLGHLAARIAEAKAGPSDERLLPLSEGQDSDLAPLFILPVENGEFSNWLYLVNAAKHQRPIWGAHVRDPSARSAFGRSSAQDLAAFAARSVQAHETRRPVFLAGYSAGTFQAIEVLRHLEAAGTPVAGLILIDPPLRSQDPDRKAWRWRRVASALVKQRNPALALERAGFVFAGTRTRELELADEDVFWTYQATPLSTDVPVFLGLAEDGNPGRPEQEATWRAVLGAAIDVHSLQGYHNTVLRDPHASGLAAILHDWMTRAEAKVKAPVAD